MSKCKHKDLEERYTYYGDGFYYCKDCRKMLTGWSYLWRKHIWTVIVGAIIFAIIQIAVLKFF